MSARWPRWVMRLLPMRYRVKQARQDMQRDFYDVEERYIEFINSKHCVACQAGTPCNETLESRERSRHHLTKLKAKGDRMFDRLTRM